MHSEFPSMSSQFCNDMLRLFQDLQNSPRKSLPDVGDPLPSMSAAVLDNVHCVAALMTADKVFSDSAQTEETPIIELENQRPLRHPHLGDNTEPVHYVSDSDSMHSPTRLPTTRSAPPSSHSLTMKRRLSMCPVHIVSLTTVRLNLQILICRLRKPCYRRD